MLSVRVCCIAESSRPRRFQFVILLCFPGSLIIIGRYKLSLSNVVGSEDGKFEEKQLAQLNKLPFAQGREKAKAYLKEQPEVARYLELQIREFARPDYTVAEKNDEDKQEEAAVPGRETLGEGESVVKHRC